MEENKKISVIIATYNRVDKLEVCVKSILNQDYENYEIIIVDDCSDVDVKTELTKVYNSEKIKYLRNEKNNLRGGLSRRIGFMESTGDIIIFCDDDDYYTDFNYFSKLNDIFKNDDIIMNCSSSYIKYEKENQTVLSKLNFDSMIDSYEYLKNFQFNYKKPNSTFTSAFRKSALIKSDLEHMNMVNDSSIYLRCLINKGKVNVIDEPIGIYSVHSSNMTANINVDFLIFNLEEKKYIYNYIKENKILDDPISWFKSQIRLTSAYYIGGSNPIRANKNKVFKWIKINLDNSFKLLLDLEFFYIKNKIKRRLK